MIQAKTIWQLSPQTGAKNLEFIELNDEINTKKSYVSVGDKQHADAERVWSLLPASFCAGAAVVLEPFPCGSYSHDPSNAAKDPNFASKDYL